MKTRLLIIIIGIGIISTSGFLIPQAFGIPYFSEEEKIEAGQFIAIGKITSYRDEGIYRFYDVKIIKWLKNPLEQETVSFRSINEKGFEPHTPKAIFEVGDYAVINLRDYGRGFLESTFFSNKISEDQIESEIKRIQELVEFNKSSLVAAGMPQLKDELVLSGSLTLNDVLLLTVISGAAIGGIILFWRKRK